MSMRQFNETFKIYSWESKITNEHFRRQWITCFETYQGEILKRLDETIRERRRGGV